MKSKHKYLYILLAAFFMAGCFKKDKAIKLPPLVRTSTYFTFSMGKNYERSAFFDLEGTDTVSGYNNNQWDLAFQCADDSFHIFLNGENEVLLLNKGACSIYTPVYPTDTMSQNWPRRPQWPHPGTIYDASSWRSDSTAFGNWYDNNIIYNQNKRNLYIIDRGALRQSGVRFRKLWVNLDYDRDRNEVYDLFFSNIDGSDFHELRVPKNPNKNFIYANLADSGHVIDFGAPKDGYDIEFTRYRHVYYNFYPPFLLYPVTGAMINPNNTRVAIDTTTAFTDITPSNFNPTNYTYSTARDVIGGYGWKSYTGGTSGTGKYIVNSKYIYIIQNRNGHYYKLHFLGYYDAQGNEGAPTFEYQKLQ